MEGFLGLVWQVRFSSQMGSKGTRIGYWLSGTGCTGIFRLGLLESWRVAGSSWPVCLLGDGRQLQAINFVI